MKEVGKWKVATSFSFIEETGYDLNKQYKESSVIWNGAKLTITVDELISKKKLDYEKGDSKTFTLFDKKDIYKSGKTYLDA